MFEQMPLSDQVYQHLYRQIIGNQFSKDMLYSESELAKTLEVSRTPVHAALLRLQKERYIDILSSRGFRLHKVSVSELTEIFQVRIAEEAYCLYLIRHNPKYQTCIPYLKTDIEEQTKALEARDTELLAQRDTGFHRRIFETIGNATFLDHFADYGFRIRDYLMQSISDEQHFTRSIEEHRQIVDYLENNLDMDIVSLLAVHHDDFSGQLLDK